MPELHSCVRDHGQLARCGPDERRNARITIEDNRRKVTTDALNAYWEKKTDER